LLLRWIDRELLEESGASHVLPCEERGLVPLSEAQGQVPRPARPRPVNAEVLAKRDDLVQNHV
jgi:hypothetical protein